MKEQALILTGTHVLKKKEQIIHFYSRAGWNRPVGRHLAITDLGNLDSSPGCTKYFFEYEAYIIIIIFICDEIFLFLCMSMIWEALMSTYSIYKYWKCSFIYQTAKCGS